VSREWVAVSDPDEENGGVGRHWPRARAVGFLLAGRGVGNTASGPSLLERFGIGDDNRVPARVDLEDESNLRALVDRLELGAVSLFGQLVVYGLSTDLPVTAQVGVAVLVVVLLDVLDRKLVARYLE
jgi:hypothetical protein